MSEEQQPTLAPQEEPKAEGLPVEELSVEEATAAAKNVKKQAVDLSFFKEIPMSVKVRLGETNLSLREVLQIEKGTVIELDKLAGEPLDLIISNKFVARGEVVVVNDSYGIRLTDLVEPEDSINKSKDNF